MRALSVSVLVGLLSLTATAAMAQGGLSLLSGRVPDAEVERLSAAADAAGVPLGDSRTPCGSMSPAGRAYLSRLRCSDGSKPLFGREGSAGVGLYGSILDLYIVACESGTPLDAAVYMDVYHPAHVERGPVSGFTLAPG